MGQKTGTPEIGHFRFAHRHRRPADLHRHMRIFDQAGRIFVIDAIETAEVPLFRNERESFIRRILYFIRM